MAKFIGLLTAGGDSPGLNAVIRAVGKSAMTQYGMQVVGFRDGWKGPLEGVTMPLGIDQVRGSGTESFAGTLLSTTGGLVLKLDDGSIQTLPHNAGVRLPELPGGLITRPTLVWDLETARAGKHAPDGLSDRLHPWRWGWVIRFGVAGSRCRYMT